MLYKKGDKSTKEKIVGQDEHEPGVIYVWFTNAAEGWKDPELLQNAIFLTEAVYKVGVFDTLSDSIQCLNFAKKLFIQYSIQYLFTQDSIQTIIQLKKFC